MILEMLCIPVIKHYAGLVTLTTAMQQTAKCCASLCLQFAKVTSCYFSPWTLAELF